MTNFNNNFSDTKEYDKLEELDPGCVSVYFKPHVSNYKIII